MRYLRYLSRIMGVSPRARQIVICGNLRGGSTIFYNMLRSAARDAVMPPSEMHAAKFWNDFRPLIITKRPLDVFHIETIRKWVGRFKKLHFVVVVRDPRSLVSSRHKSIHGDFFQGFDHTYFVSERSKSLTKPGVVDCFEAIDKVLENPRVASTVVRYEDLIRDPDQVQRSLSENLGIEWNGRFSDFHRSDIPPALAQQLNGIRPVDTANIDAWRHGERARRVVHQFSLEPKLFSILRRWGYETDGAWFDRLARKHPRQEMSTNRVVAFYTEGTFYEDEARRMRVSAQRHGLTVDLTPVRSAGSWVQNASMKAGFLVEQRRKYRGPLLYVDVDSVFHTDPWPYLHAKDGDFGVFVSRSGEMITATILINDTPGALELLERWAETSNRNPNEWDQRVLQKIVEDDENAEVPRFQVQRLPPSFCWIFDGPERQSYGEVVIEQLQASREAKKEPRRFRPTSRKLKRRIDRIREIETQFLGSSPDG